MQVHARAKLWIMKKTTNIRVYTTTYTRLKIAAAKAGKSLVQYIDELMKK
jgi:predicted HicB family RNase H-like nuclease